MVLKILRPRQYEKLADRVQVKREIENHSIVDHKNVLRMLGHNMSG